MKATALKKEPRFVLRNDKAFKVQNYGDGNDYPQQIMEIVNASGTGKSCVGVYAKFISGKGFEDIDLYKKVVNRYGQTNDYIYDQVSKDYAMFSGFALHVNYNTNFQIVELQHVPFEQVRFEMLHPETYQFNKVALHPDWGRRFLYLRRWKKEDIKFIDFFNPDPIEIQTQVDLAGGWSNYKGQVLYFSNEGERVYPLPSFDSVLTDMNTEEGISNVSNRNARNNFLTAGAFINKVSTNKSSSGNSYSDSEEDGERRHENGEYDRDEDNGIEKALKAFQGDENAGKMLYIEIETDEEKPEFISFKGTNYDKEFDVTLKSSQANIGKAFNQPPILRAESVGSNFGADLMLNAYNYYNSVTENERLNMERVFSTIFQHWFEPLGSNFSIIPLSYEVEMTLADRLGDAQLKEIILLMNNKDLTIDQKKSIAKTLFGLTYDETNNLVPIPTTPPTV